MILVEISEPSNQNVNFIKEENKNMLKEALNLGKETIKEVHMRVKLFQRRAENRYNSQVKPRNFLVGDLVPRKCGEAQKDPKEGKLTIN